MQSLCANFFSPCVCVCVCVRACARVRVYVYAECSASGVPKFRMIMSHFE
jgi:hypothetical protein